MKKLLIVTIAVVLSGMILVPFAVADTEDSQDIVPGNDNGTETLFVVLRSVQIKPYRIVVDYPEMAFSWKPVYTRFFDHEDNRLSAGQFLNNYRHSGIGVWLDEEGIAKIVRPVDF